MQTAKVNGWKIYIFVQEANTQHHAHLPTTFRMINNPWSSHLTNDDKALVIVNTMDMLYDRSSKVNPLTDDQHRGDINYG